MTRAPGTSESDGDARTPAAEACSATPTARSPTWRGWEAEYPRDVWRMRRLGYDGDRPLRFAAISQPWLRHLTKTVGALAAVHWTMPRGWRRQAGRRN